MTVSFALRFAAIILIAGSPGSTVTCSGKGFRDTSKPAGEKTHLNKRSVLTFPPNSVLQLNMGVTLAGQLERNSAGIVLAFQQNAPLPVETQPLFFPSLVDVGKEFSIYDHLENVIGSYGFNGVECLRKMICQIGETPLAGGLLEDVITFVLSPSKHRSVREPGVARSDMELLLESERLGMRGGNCTSAFPLCVRTPLDMISASTRI